MTRCGAAAVAVAIVCAIGSASGAEAANRSPREANSTSKTGPQRCPGGTPMRRGRCARGVARTRGAEMRLAAASAPRPRWGVGAVFPAPQGVVAAGPPAPGAPIVVSPPEAAPPAPPAPPSLTARLQVTAREFSLQFSRPAVAAGPLVLELVNRGEDPHDLRVRPAAGGGDVLSIGLTDPFGGVGEAEGPLEAGTFTLFCSLPGHEAAGMRATLTVR